LFNSLATGTDYLYTGQQFDSLTGLYSLRARYYNPALGRFLSQDTYPYNFGNPVELNRYVYTGNRPINLTDPTGNAALVEYAIRLGAIGGGAGALSAIACGKNPLQGFFLGAAFGLAFAGGFAGLAYLTSPGIAITVGAGIAGGQAAYSIYDFIANNTTWCGATNAALSLLFLGLALHGGANYLAEKYLGGLGEIGYPGELNNPNGMGHEGYYTGEYQPINTKYNGTPLYRGLDPANPYQRLQLEIYRKTGTIQPRGGNATLVEHVNEGNTASNYTSWSKSYAAAKIKAGKNGVVLPINTAEITNITFDSYLWSKFPFEMEITIEGPVPGANIIIR